MTIQQAATSAATALPTRRLRRTDMEITRVGFGAWAIGGADWAASCRWVRSKGSLPSPSLSRSFSNAPFAEKVRARGTKRSALSAHFVVRRLKAAA